jgi:hypothetical protein
LEARELKLLLQHLLHRLQQEEAQLKQPLPPQ